MTESQIEAKRMKDSCRAATYFAVKTGKLRKLPCEACGEPKVQAHHKDYKAPLSVQWLCKDHHWDEHRGKAKAEHFTCRKITEFINKSGLTLHQVIWMWTQQPNYSPDLIDKCVFRKTDDRCNLDQVASA